MKKRVNKKIRVSYIVTTKNRADYFAKTLNNIKEFITSRDELIIVDGGSTDKTAQLVKKNKDIVSTFISETDFGEAHALNKGLLIAKGKYIKILTDDDYIYPKAMRRAIRVLEKNPKIDALQCGGEAYIFNPKTKKYEILFYEQIFPGIKIAKNQKHLMTYAPCGLGLVFRSNIIPRIGLFDTTYRAVDLYIMSRIIKLGLNFKYLNIDLYKVFIHPHSGTHQVEDIWRDEVRVFLDKGMWSEAIGSRASVLTKTLGLDKLAYGESFVWLVKLLEKLRESSFGWLIGLLGGLIGKAKTTYVGVNFKIRGLVKTYWYKARKEPIPKPQRPKRDGKFW